MTVEERKIVYLEQCKYKVYLEYLQVYLQVYLEQCKYKVKKREMKSFIDYEIELDSDYASD